MGKNTGFIEYKRINKAKLPPLERISSFHEFLLPLAEEEQKRQAARCISCGIPFCSSPIQIQKRRLGCPLANQIPEWNDLIYKGLYKEAYRRLSLTSPFPEFTSRVCPALCEAICTESIHDEAVSVKANESFIIETAFELNWVKANPPKKRNNKRICIVGSGPAGLSAAYYLNQAGFSVDVYEREDRIGGLLMYGIPEMKLAKTIVERRVHLLEEEGISFYPNRNIGVDLSMEDLKKTYDEIILACGTSLSRGLTIDTKGLNGIYYALDFLKQTTKDLLNGNEFKISCENKNVVIIGGGDTANDCVATAMRQYAKSVTTIEIMPRPSEERTNAWPEYPNSLKTDYGVEEANEYFGKDIRRFQTTIEEVFGKKNIDSISIHKVGDDKEPKTREILPCDILLLAMGFIGTATEDIERLKLPARGNKILAVHHKIEDHLYIGGDMIQGPSLVVVAIEDGKEVAQEIIKKYEAIE